MTSALPHQPPSQLANTTLDKLKRGLNTQRKEKNTRGIGCRVPGKRRLGGSTVSVGGPKLNCMPAIVHPL
jgi:hypothetical protein